MGAIIGLRVSRIRAANAIEWETINAFDTDYINLIDIMRAAENDNTLMGVGT